MKSRFLLQLIIIVLVGVILIPGIAFSQEQNIVDLKALFSEYSPQLDGIYAEEYAFKLGDSFRKDKVAFISELANQPKDKIESISLLTAYNCEYFDLSAIRMETKYLVDSNQLTAEQVGVANQIIIAMDQITQLRQAPVNDNRNVKLPDFDVATVKDFIKIHKQNGNPIDEEYYQTLKNSLKADAKAFIKVMTEFDDATQQDIAQSVNYNLSETDKVNFKENFGKLKKDSELNEKEKEAINKLISTLNEKSKSNSSDNKETPVNTTSIEIPTIGTMYYTTTPLVVGESENFQYTLSETYNKLAIRTYYVKIYAIKNGVAYLKATQNVTIPSGSISVTLNAPVSYTSTGLIYTKVEVYSSASGGKLTEKTTTSTDTIYGKWKINVALPINRNYKGTLKLYKADGSLAASMECLGRSVSNASMYEYQGNTPTGTYTGYLYGPVSPSSSYGPYKVVNMTGVSGAIITSGRTGIWIHGGDPSTDTTATWYPLRPTYGCVRIANTNQKVLQDQITTITSSEYHYSTGNIYISES